MSQIVVVNGFSSLKSDVLSGVPRGSILGPLLFIIYLNGLSSVPLLSSAKLTMYADDILLSHPFDSLSEPCLILTQFLPGSLPTILLLTLPKPNTCSSLSNPHLAFPLFPLSILMTLLLNLSLLMVFS